MKICNGCNTKYEDHEAFCHKCECALKGKNCRNKLNKNDINTLWRARRSIVNIHGCLATIYILVIAIGAYSTNRDGTDLGPMGTYIFIFPLLFPAIHFAAIYGIKRDLSWGRTLSYCIGVLFLFGFPIGTVIGAYLLFQLNRKEWSYLR